MEPVYTSNISYLITVEQTQIHHTKTQETKQLIHIPTIHNQQQHSLKFTQVLSCMGTNTLAFDAFCCLEVVEHQNSTAFFKHKT